MYFDGWEKFNADGASLDFFRKVENGVVFIGFDSSSCVPPEPMVNAMIALNFIQDRNTKVIMINHKFPAGLIPKIETIFDYETKEIEDKRVEIIFSLKHDAKPRNLDVNQNCHG